MSEQLPADMTPQEEVQETELNSTLPAKEWLNNEAEYYENRAVDDSVPKELQDEYERMSDIYTKTINFLQKNPSIDKILQDTILHDLISPIARSTGNEHNDGLVAMQIAAYLHTLPEEK